MDQISGWARLQDDMKASFEQATGVIRQLREGNERLRAERDLLRKKIVRSADQQEETSALLKRTGVIVKKLMDDNDMLRKERQRLVEESVDFLKQRLEDTKELIAARRGDEFLRPAATHQESRDQRARSLSSFFFCPCVFRA